MRLYTTLILSVILPGIFISTSCSFKQQQVLFKQQKSNTNDTLNGQRISGTGTSDYRIQSQDILQIRNLQSTKYITDAVPTGSGGNSTSEGQSFQVDDDGTLTLPVIGRIPIAGLTRNEAAKQIESLYRKNLLVNPIIEIKITNLKVTILGEIRSQGNFPLVKDKTSIVEMIGQAGGLTPGANEKNIMIIRGDPKNPQITEVDLSKLTTLADPRIILQNNDIIYIAQSKRAIKNDQLQNFTTTISPILLVFNTALIIYTLIHR